MGWLVALRSSRLPHQSACSPFMQSLFPSLFDSSPSSLGT
jgi:hypothetical protein